MAQATVTKDAEGNLLKVKLHRIPHDFRRTAVRNMERTGVSRSAAVKVKVVHKSKAVYKRYAIVGEVDITEELAKVPALHEQEAGERPKIAPFKAQVRPESHKIRAAHGEIVRKSLIRHARLPVSPLRPSTRGPAYAGGPLPSRAAPR